MINNKYDLLKVLIANMDTNTHRVANIDNVIKNLLDVQTKCDYLAELKGQGLISVYYNNSGEVEIHDKAISYIKGLD